MKLFIGKWPQVVTELNKCYEPMERYELSESEMLVLYSRGFLSLFEEVPVVVAEPVAVTEQERPAKKGK